MTKVCEFTSLCVKSQAKNDFLKDVEGTQSVSSLKNALLQRKI